MLDGGTTLRNWRSSNPLLQEKISKYENSTTSTNEKVKVLGVPWNSETDQLCMELSFSTVVTSLEGVVKISTSHFWCDALDWIKGDHRNRNVFVGNRVRAIRQTVNPCS